MMGGDMEIRIYYEDTDAGGVVYHANYLSYFERGRTEYLRQRGLSVRQLHLQGAIFPVVRAEIDFRAPAVHDDLIRIDTAVLKVGKSSFTLGQQVVRLLDDKLLVEAEITLVCVSHNFKAKRLPAELVEILNGP